MIDSGFSFQWNSLFLVVSILVLVVTCGLAWIACARSRFRSSVVWIELFRVLLVALAVLLLNQPEMIYQIDPTRRPTVVVLGDDSLSMDTTDTGDELNLMRTRRESIGHVMDERTWAAVQQDADVIVMPFASGAKNDRTDIDAALSSAIDGYPHLRAVVLASDGDWNAGATPVEAATQFRMQQIPIFTIPVGSQERLPDVELLSFDVPALGVANKTLRIPFAVESSLAQDHRAIAKLTASDGTEATREFTIHAMGQTSETILWKPQQTGEFQLTLSIPMHASERITSNNELSMPISIPEEQLKVLVIESRPRWEYRYLRNALSRDPGIEVSCLLFHPGLSKTGGGNRDYIASFPSDLAELSQYDVVFLGDVGVGEDQLSEEQCRLLKGLVEQQASGLVVIPGIAGHMMSLVDSPLGDLLPVTLDESQPTGWGARTPSHFALTEAGRHSLLTKLADDDDSNARVWAGLPGFQWYAAVVRATAGAEVLAVHEDASNQYGRTPLIVTRSAGAGKVLFMGTDGAWRWRRGVEDLYHYRFWGQVVRWMAYQHRMSKGLFYSPEQPRVNQRVTLSANRLGDDGNPLAAREVSVRIVAPSGQVQNVLLENIDDTWGAYAGAFTPSEAGDYQVTMPSEAGDSPFETTIHVQHAKVERIGKPARPEVLAEIARISRGEMFSLKQLDSLQNAVAAISVPTSQTRRVQLWSHPLVAILMISLLGLFWIARKRVGLM
ncbi:hypothetical protein [Novipirellula caenicola]|uniref:Glutamine amidotransferase domain-containing protein n=1 Tax=Novipirellula caenicola TaxID=1536901 RepID=A0ABP9VQI1_9BACT